MGAKKTIKDLNRSLKNSFSRIKEDVVSLKKTRKQLSKEVNNLNLKQVEFDKDVAKNEDIHKMQLKVENIAYEQKSIKEFSDILAFLKKESVMKREYDRAHNKTKNEVSSLRKEVDKIKKSRDIVKEARVIQLEKSLMKIDDVKKEILDDVKRKYLTAEEVAAEINPLKKEFLDLYNKVNKVTREVLSYPKLKFFGDVMLLIAIISLAGAGISLYFNYYFAANFLGIEALIFFIIGIIVMLIHKMSIR